MWEPDSLLLYLHPIMILHQSEHEKCGSHFTVSRAALLFVFPRWLALVSYLRILDDPLSRPSTVLCLPLVFVWGESSWMFSQGPTTVISYRSWGFYCCLALFWIGLGLAVSELEIFGLPGLIRLGHEQFLPYARPA